MASAKIRPEHVGLTVHRVTEWPVCGARRIHDDEHGTRWCDIETSPGVYEWGGLAALARRAYADGFKLIGVVMGTPAFYATARRPDVYGAPGGATMPNDPGALAQFVFAMVRFLNRRSAVNPTGRRLMPVLESLNEPKYGFWHGTLAESVEYTRIVSAAARRADPGIIVAGPSFAGVAPDHMVEFLAAGGGAHIDAVSPHLYGADSATIAQQVEAIRAAKARVGFGHLRIASTERGFEPSRAGQPFLSMSHEAQADEYLRTSLYLASQPDVVCDVWYDWDGDHKPGVIYAMRDKPAFAAGLAAMVALIGKTARTEVLSGRRQYRVSGRLLAL